MWFLLEEEKMKCFKCKAECVTNYYICPIEKKITHVNKMCVVPNCGWESYPTKLPEKITRV